LPGNLHRRGYTTLARRAQQKPGEHEGCPLVSSSPHILGLAANRCASPRRSPFDSVRNVVYTVRDFVLPRLIAHRFVSLHRIALFNTTTAGEEALFTHPADCAPQRPFVHDVGVEHGSLYVSLRPRSSCTARTSWRSAVTMDDGRRRTLLSSVQTLPR